MINIDKLRELNREAQMTEAMQFSPYIDIEIITAFKKALPAKLQVKKTPIPVYRCYFIESDIAVTYMTHLLTGEYEIFQKIVNDSFNHNPSIRLYVLTENDVVLEKEISVHIFAHLLFRFHHRITKKYIDEERFLF